MHLEKFIIPEKMGQDTYLNLISTLMGKFWGVKNEFPEFVWDKMKKTIWYTRHEVVFVNGYKIIIWEKHKIRVAKDGIIIPGKPLEYSVVNTIWFTY